ncbi:glycosyltransferase [Agrobacterium salinitolerans]|uniref:Glycosyltransferase n=1 Tax=Agrobacterium salinitolerans TaxID=1183413 RepID=A0A9X3KQT9_9HYPH|nr:MULTISPECIES: glycosyltransferase [Agrobacterium]MCZ7851180.1 glycosyltransferase [Agrobacterium salinitolerans]MCZ7890470.1 glycosyltransferase [Agrobacterium salinitolerans]MCZ7938473.1 glycosyltransferase [Agrobacterium salinitolerans]MCZ7974130.1 glycosyltransferase [Agrobacterium salinitolerans]
MINQFVYNEIDALSLSRPDIEVAATPHFAQCAEDVIVLSILRALAQRESFDLSSQRYLEIGANHPVATSATYLLRKEASMSGVLIEGNPSLIAELERARSGDVVVNRAVTARYESEVKLFISNQSELSSLSKDFVEDWQEGRVGLKEVVSIPAIQINQIFENYFSEVLPLYMSIDVEGMDLELLQALDWHRWRPAVVQAEPSEHFITDNAAQITEFMISVGYTLLAKTNVNLVFVDKARIFSKPNNTEAAQITSRNSSSSLTPSIGVVMRTKDRAVLLRRALESVKNQTYQNWRLVIVNDGGETTDVDWLVEKIFAGDDRVTVVHHDRSKGMEAASNAGIATLSTDYVLIHDDDDSLAPEFMSSMSATIVAKKAIFPSIKGVVCRLNTVYETVTGHEITIERIEPFKSWHSDGLDEGFLSVQKMMVRNQFPPIAFMFELAAARELGLFDESLPVLGDWDFHSRFVLKHDVWILPEYLSFYHHRVSATGAMGNTVHAGASRHRLYSQKIRNELIRKSAGPDGSNRFLLTIPMELQEQSQDQYGGVLSRLHTLESMVSQKASRPKWRKKLSSTFRKVRNFVLRRGN